MLLNLEQRCIAIVLNGFCLVCVCVRACDGCGVVGVCNVCKKKIGGFCH